MAASPRNRVTPAARLTHDYPCNPNILSELYHTLRWYYPDYVQTPKPILLYYLLWILRSSRYCRNPLPQLLQVEDYANICPYRFYSQSADFSQLLRWFTQVWNQITDFLRPEYALSIIFLVLMSHSNLPQDMCLLYNNAKNCIRDLRSLRGLYRSIRLE